MATHWYSGDLQNHEDYSVPIEEHCEICKRAGYDFICLQYKDMQDFSLIRDAAELTTEDFLVIPGAEQAFQSRAGRWAHFGFMPFPIPMPDTITDEFNIPQGIAEAERRHPGCIKTIHHPADERWELGDIQDAYAGGARFIELNPEGTPLQWAVDLWDRSLTAGLRLYANLSTDAHGHGTIRRRGYVLVRAEALNQEAIFAGLTSGDYLAVEEGCVCEVIELVRPEWAPGAVYRVSGDQIASIRFIGKGGRVLSHGGGSEGEYILQGDEQYVRVEIFGRAGMRAFSQPIFES